MDKEFRKLAFEQVIAQYEGKFWKERGKQSALAAVFGISPASISQWKINGIPSSRIPYFKLKFPKLPIWKEIRESKY